jgi:hypothetical protein
MNNLSYTRNKIDVANTNQEPDNLIDMDILLIKLKNEDARTLRKMKNFKWLFIIMVIVYALLLVINPDPELQFHVRISGLCYTVAFAFFAFIFRKYYIEFRRIDYSLSSSEMFSQAADRYNLTLTRYFIVLPSLILVDIGLTISEYYRWTSIEPLNRILIVQAIFIPVLLISGFIGYLVWRKRQKPIREGALQMLKELNEI